MCTGSDQTPCYLRLGRLSSQKCDSREHSSPSRTALELPFLLQTSVAPSALTRELSFRGIHGKTLQANGRVMLMVFGPVSRRHFRGAHP